MDSFHNRRQINAPKQHLLCFHGSLSVDKPSYFEGLSLISCLFHVRESADFSQLYQGNGMRSSLT